MHSVSNRRLHREKSLNGSDGKRAQKYVHSASFLHAQLNRAKTSPRFAKFARIGLFVFAVLFATASLSSSGVSPFGTSIFSSANSTSGTAFGNLISFSGTWGTLKLPDSDSVVRENQFGTANRSSSRDEETILGAVALNGDINISPKSYIGNPDAPIASGNDYGPGYCTWYAYNRRIDIGLPALGGWGDAYQWTYSAAAAGYKVDHNPQIGDIVSINGGWLGHVAIVEEIGPNNTVRISEMNYGYPYNYNERWIINATDYLYIH